MASNSAQDLLQREMRMTTGKAPRTLEDGPIPEHSWQLVGDQFLLRNAGCHYYHYRKGAGVTIERDAHADRAEENLWMNGSVYSAVASINGLLPLHASAVCHDGQVHAFTGPSGSGKSTLVTALAATGLPLFCDDTLVLDLSDPDAVMCLPGHKRLKLDEAALRLTGAAREEQVSRDIDKFYAEPSALHEGGPLPLARLFMLEEGQDIRTEAIAGAQRMLQFGDDHYTAQHYAAARGFDATSHFEHLAQLARHIPVSRFIRPRNLSRFGDGVDAVCRYIDAERGSDREGA